MFIFCRKIKNLSIALSLLIVMVSCGASIQMHTCNSEGISVVSINKITSESSCGDCCDKHETKLSFKKDNCCEDKFVSAFFKANSNHSIENFVFKKHFFTQNIFKSFSINTIRILDTKNTFDSYISFIPIRYSNTLLILKCVFNI